jgi:DNA-binding MarR family transcriptional regulator
MHNPQKLEAALTIIRQATARIEALSDAIFPGAAGMTLHAVADRLYSERRRRERHFPQGLFKEPAWDLMLALFIAREEGRELDLIQACEVAGVTPGAGRSLLAKMESEGLVARAKSNRNRKRQTVALTKHSIERLSDYLAALI